MAAMAMEHQFDPSRKYVIENKHARGKYLNVAGAAHNDGANIHVRSACKLLKMRAHAKTS